MDSSPLNGGRGMGRNWWVAAAGVVILFFNCALSFGDKRGFEHFTKGIDYYKHKGDFEAAGQEFTQAFMSDKSNIYYQAWLGKVVVDELKDYDKAIGLLEEAPNKRDSSDALYWLGKAYYRRGVSRQGELRIKDFARAMEYVEKAYHMGREPEAKELLAEIESRMPSGEGDKKNLFWKLGALFGITVIAVCAVVALRRFALQQPSALRDVILFLVLVVVVVLSAALLGIISGQQFAEIIRGMFETIKTVFPAGS